jgi:hypothetical protein
MRLLGNKKRLKRLEERLEKRLEERLRRMWVRIGETLKRLSYTRVGRWCLAWVSGAVTTRYHTLRPTASTRRHGPRALAAIISERGRGTCLLYRTGIQTDHVTAASSPMLGTKPMSASKRSVLRWLGDAGGSKVRPCSNFAGVITNGLLSMLLEL